MKKHLLPQGKKLYKANMHTHTTLSDGRMTPEEIKAAYKEQGYSIVAYTDHEVIVLQNHLRDEEFLPITSFEIVTNQLMAENAVPNSNRTYHLNLYSFDPENTVSSAFWERKIWKRIEHIKEYVSDEMRAHQTDRTYSVACMNEIIAKAREEGFLVSYNHPVWSLQNYSDYAGLRGLWGVEIHNTGCVLAGLPDTPQPWEDILRQGERVYPLATDDTHAPKDCFGGWLMVSADQLEYKDVMQALENGDFYASTGPEIHEISIENGVLHVACSEAVSVAFTTERRDSKQVTTKDTPITEADFDLTGYLEKTGNGTAISPPYVRVTVTDACGKHAWSRAYFLDEL
ncbi:MAG: hypothetical protein IJW30_00190 [Clostridia bacterium]|nr:hypothetical protein [Clostridia bacterium]